MLSNRIIDAAFDSLFKDFRQTLGIGVLPFVVGIALFAVLNASLILQLMTFQGGMIRVSQAQIALLFLGVAVLFYCGTHVAVRWHCYSLDVPPMLQRNYQRSFLYLPMSLLFTGAIIVLLLLVLALPAGVLLGEVSVKVGSYSEAIQRGWPHVLVTALGTFLFMLLFLKWATMWLVAHAVGNTARGPHWTTSLVWREIIHIAALYTLATFLWTFVGGFGLTWYIDLVLQLAVSWLAFMLSIALLTEIYREVGARAEAKRAGARSSEPS